MSVQNIPEDKYRRMMRAGMENFAKNGYRKTTMDEIVADAGVSKGLIFHYFGNKMGLYTHLYKFAYGLVYDRIVPNFDERQPDLFERIRAAEQGKLAVVREYPYVLDFLMSIKTEENSALREELRRASKEVYPEWTGSFTKGIDTSKLRDGIDLAHVIKIILWCTNGLIAEHKEGFKMEEIIDEMDVYLALMRKAFYREEYQ